MLGKYWMMEASILLHFSFTINLNCPKLVERHSDIERTKSNRLTQILQQQKVSGYRNFSSSLPKISHEKNKPNVRLCGTLCKNISASYFCLSSPNWHQSLALGRCTFAVYSVIWKQIKLGFKLHRQRDKSPFDVAFVYVALIWSRNRHTFWKSFENSIGASYSPSSFLGESCSSALASSALTWKAIFLVHHVN